jgi:hypothetical protein
MTAKPGAIDSNRLGVCGQHPMGGFITACRAVTTAFLFLIVIFFLTGCATMSRHQFTEPTGDWQAKSGQLMYRAAKTTLIGDVFVRFSKSGDFELTFSKGPAVTLLSLRQDASFAEVKGAFVRDGWSGPVEQAPQQLRGWLGLRDKLIHSQDRQSVRYVTGNETFLFRFQP